MTRKKILMISLVLLAIISLGAVSAADDVSIDDAQVLDDLNLDDNSDISIEDASTDVVSDDDSDIAIEDESNSIDDSKETLGSSKLGDDAQVVTSANFFDYFDANGNLKSSVSGDLTFKDEFSAIVPSITLNKGITINSDSAVLRNMAVKITATDVVLNGLTLISDASVGDLIYVGASDATLTNLDISYSVGDEDAIAINIDGADNVEITNSSIFFESSVSSDEKTAIAINVFDALDILIDGNDITTKLPALYVQNYDWDYMLMGLTTVNPIKFKEVDGLVFSNNIQDSTINNGAASYATSQSMFIVGCNDINIIDNDFSMVDTLTPVGTNIYLYAFTIGFTTESNIIGNNFNIFTNGGSADAGTAYAIQVVEADLNITDNIIVSKSNGPNLGIYAASMNGEDSHLYISDNFINVTGLATTSSSGWGLVSGIEIQNGIGQIYNNTIYTYNTEGYDENNYLYGVSYAQWMGGQRSFDVRDNVIVTEGKYAVSVIDADSLNVTGNTLIAHDLSGDDAVNPGDCTETDIRDNTDEIPSPVEPITPNIEITANNVWNGYSNDIIVNVTGMQDTETVIATGSVTIKINGKEETIELVEGIATYTIPAEDIVTGANTVTVSYSGSDEFEAGTATASFKTLDGVVTNETFFDYFNRAENGRLYAYIPDGVTLDFQGAFYSTPERNFTMNINKPVNIITSTHDAFIDLNTTAGSLFGEDPGDSFAITYGGSGTNVTDIVFHNSQIWVFNAHNVTLDHINNTIEDQRVGSGNGATSIRANSTYVTVKNSYFYTRNNGGSSSLVMAWADHCTFDNNTIVVEGNVGNMIYLTTYNVDVPSGVLANQYNTITNNKIYGFKEPAAICWGLVISGANNLIEGNFIDYGGTGINAQWGQGDFVNNTYRNNVLINGSAFNAPDGSTVYNNSVAGAMNTGKNTLAYNNTVGKNLTVGIGATAYDNTANGLIVNENATAYDNIINGATQVNGKNAVVRDSELNGAVTLKGDNSKVLDSIIVGDVTLSGNNTLLQGSDVDGNISFGTKSAGTATVDENVINGQITTKASNNNLVITNNVIHTDEEYAIVLKSSNNIVEYNQLYAAEKKGEEAVSFDASKNNTVENNYPPYMPKIEIETPVIWIGNSADIVITVSNLEGAETILATGNVTVKINGKEETIELTEGKATYTIPAEDITAGENTVTVTYNGADDFATGEENATFTPLDGVVTKDTFKYYFDEENNGALFPYVPEGATLDFQGDFLGAYTTNINKPVNIVSTTGDAFIETNKTGSFNILEGGSGTNVSGLSFLNTAFYITTAHDVVIDGINMVANMSGVGSGTGFLCIRQNSEYVTVKNSYFENGGTGSSCVVIGTSSHCTIDNNVLNATKNSGNILYITTYVGTGATPTYNSITNNVIESQVSSAFCYAIAVIGGYNNIENNTINHPGAGIVQQSTWGGAPQPNGFNTYINNTLTGGCGLTAMVNSTVLDNTVEGAMTLNADCTAEGNTVNSLTVNGANCIVKDNTVNGAVTVAKAAKNTEITGNTISGLVTVNSDENTITENEVRTSTEYAIDLKTGANNTVTGNVLYASEKAGDDAVNFDESKENTVRDNYPPYKPDIQIDVTAGWAGSDTNVAITVTNANGQGTILASGNVTIKINGKEETIELAEGKATYIIPGEYITAGENTVTVVYNGDDDFLTGEESATFTPLDGVVTKDTFKYYFDEENNGVLYPYVPEGATLDFQGDFLGAYTVNINKPVNIVSTTGDAFIETNKTGSFNILEGGSGTNVSGLKFLNTAFYITTAHDVVIDGINMVANMSGVGSGTGFLCIRQNSEYVTVKNSYFENGGTGSSCVVIGTSSHCTIDNNVLNATKNSGNILYITTYVGTGATPTYNSITNNVIESQVSSAFCYAIAVIGGYNNIENNTINHPGAGIVQQSTWGGAPQPNGFNTYINNTLTGGCGLTAMVNSTVLDNTVEGAMTLNADCTAEGNTVNSLTVNGANCIVKDNTVNGAVTVAKAAKNTEMIGNTISGLVTVNSDNNIITDNGVTSTSEYAIDLKTGANNIVTDNYLFASEKSGDAAVKFAEDSNNTVKDNYPLNSDLTLIVDDVVIGEESNIQIRLTDSKGTVSGTVKITVNGAEYNVTVTDGKGSVAVGPFEEIGTVPIVAEFVDEFHSLTIVEDELTVYGPGNVTVKHTDAGDAHDIQAAIDAANPGDIVRLGDYDYTDVSDVNITKDVALVGSEGTTVTSAGDGNPIFNVPAKSENGPDSVNITGIDFKVNNGDVIVKATADNDTNPLSIDTQAISITDNTIEAANEDVVPESVTVLQLESERGVLAPTNDIAISGNTMDAGINPFDFDVTSVVSGSDVNIPSGPITKDRTETQIVYENMSTTAVDVDTDGRVGEYFYITLKDKDNNLLANKPVQIGFNGQVYDRVTDENGSARLQINLKNAGTYTFAVSYLGDDEYNGSFIVAKIVVSKQKGSLTVPAKTYKASATSKTLTATFKSASGKVVSGKKITFTVNGKSYSATTNEKGVATVKVSINKKGTYSFTAKFAGNTMYAAMNKTAKLTIN